MKKYFFIVEYVNRNKRNEHYFQLKLKLNFKRTPMNWLHGNTPPHFWWPPSSTEERTLIRISPCERERQYINSIWSRVKCQIVHSFAAPNWSLARLLTDEQRPQQPARPPTTCSEQLATRPLLPVSCRVTDRCGVWLFSGAFLATDFGWIHTQGLQCFQWATSTPEPEVVDTRLVCWKRSGWTMEISRRQILTQGVSSQSM